MRFYFFSIFSVMLYAGVISIAIVLLTMAWVSLLKFKLRNPVYWILVAALLVGPWGEELWIAYNFNQLCRKDAGVFINRTVEVDGYYNDAGAGTTRIVGSPPYKFVETPDGKGKYLRIERASAMERDRAISWYVQGHNGSKPAEKEWFSQPVNDSVRVTVEMDTGNTWRITELDEPTARYQYKGRRYYPVSYKIRQTEFRVEDRQTGAVLGRETVYARDAYWFFVGLDAPVMLCPAPGEDSNERYGLIYKQILKPQTTK